MNARRTFYALVLASLFLFGATTAARWAGLFFALVAVVSYGYSSVIRQSLAVGRELSTVYLYRAETFEVVLTVKNRGPLATLPLIVVDHAPGLFTNGRESHVLRLAGRQTRVLRYQVHARRRGVFSLGPLVVEGSDPLGLFPWQLRFELPAEIVVLPDIRSISLPGRPVLPGGPGTTSDPVFEDAILVRALRDYLPGDRPRSVHWKASARLGRLVVKQPALRTEMPTVVVLDLRADAYPLRRRSRTLERAVEVATALVVRLLSAGHPVGLYTLAAPRELIPPAAGAGRQGLLLRRLARVQAVPGVGALPEEVLQLPHSTLLAYVGPLPNTGVLIARRPRSRLALYILGGQGPVPQGAVLIPNHGPL